MAQDLFSPVLGRGRGRQRGDTVVARQPSSAASEDLESYLVELRGGDFDRTMGLLAKERDLIPSRPLLRGLAQELSQALVSQSSRRLDEALRRFLDRVGIYSSLSDHLVVAPAARERQGDEPEPRRLHVWPDGDCLGPMPYLEDASQTVCGLEISRRGWQRAPRGAWTSEGLADLKWDTCAQCQLACPPALRHDLAEGSAYEPFGHELHRRMLKEIAKGIIEGIASGPADSVPEMVAQAQATYCSMLLPATVACAQKGGEAVIQRLMEPRAWRDISRNHGRDLHDLLQTEDWREALAPCLPRPEGDGVVEATEEGIVAARSGLVELLRERVGVPDLAEIGLSLRRERQEKAAAEEG
jgi:hypothetical protein